MFLKGKKDRAVAFVMDNGEVLIFTKNNFIRNKSEITDYVSDDLKLFDKDNDDVQILKVNIYEDVIYMPEQTLYSIPYNANKVPDRSALIPKEVFNIVWNYLEGAKGEKRENQFLLKPQNAKIA